MDDFFLRAIAAGLAVAVIAGPVGAAMLWQRKTFFGAAIAHSAVLGIAVGLVAGFSPFWSAFAVCIGLAFLMELLFRDRHLSSDTITGVMGHGSLAGAYIVWGFLDTYRADLSAYLFGDILAATSADVYQTVGFAALTAVILVALWRPLMTATAEPAIAKAEGIDTQHISLAYSLLLAVVIAIGLRLVGALLIIALLVVPAATARPFTSHPVAMAMLAAVIGCLSVLGGLLMSYAWDWPAGPAIAVIAVGFFGLSRLLPR